MSIISPYSWKKVVDYKDLCHCGKSFLSNLIPILTIPIQTICKAVPTVLMNLAVHFPALLLVHRGQVTYSSVALMVKAGSGADGSQHPW